ncbi:MAG: hypothetical protein LUE64_07355 [Candidatus Gastranaerophilales bacterium]|nr:hypothetical protein [Candidatus Gastranaerophilales bacterium]
MKGGKTMMTATEYSLNTQFMADVDFSKYQNQAFCAIDEIQSRKGKKGQFLNWIGVLQNNQINNIDSIYELYENSKKGFEDLAVLGIGGSRHTSEAMVKMLNADKNIRFYSSVDPISFERFKNSLNLDKTKFLVVSKSGGTLETTTAYNSAKTLMQNHLNRDDVSDRFVGMTDASSEKSALRRLVNSGELQGAGYVHDDVGGRFSIFDDATIFILFWAGYSKNQIIQMLKSSLEAQEMYMNKDISQNPALRQAIFNVNSKLNGKQRHFVEYFGDAFAGAILWEKQLKNESLKAKIATDTNIGPGYLHYNAEADLDNENTNSFFTFVYVKTEDKTTNAVLSGVVSAYSNMHPVSVIELNGLDLNTIAQFIELKHFETLYTGNILRRMNNNITSADEAMPEVLQPNVEIYKKEVKKALLN